MLKTEKLTADAFLAEYSMLPDAGRYELIEGEVAMSPEASPYHGELQSAVLWVLTDYVLRTEHGRVFGPTNLVLGSGNCVGPDAMFVLPTDKVSVQEAKVTGAPSLLVKIVSPNQPSLDLLAKRELYTANKVAEIWFLDCACKEALFLSKSGSRYREQRMAAGLFESKALKGFKFDVGALFALDRKTLRKSTGA